MHPHVAPAASFLMEQRRHALLRLEVFSKTPSQKSLAETQPGPHTHPSVPTSLSEESAGLQGLPPSAGAQPWTRCRGGESVTRGAAGSAGCPWAVGIAGRVAPAVEMQAVCVCLFLRPCCLFGF